MIEHIAEDVIEKFAIFPLNFSPEERERIQAHLADCASCREEAERFRSFYQAVGEELNNPPTEKDKALAEQILARRKRLLPFGKLKLPSRSEVTMASYAEIVEPAQRPLSQRIVRYIQRHPIQAAGGFSLAAAALVMVALMPHVLKDNNPSFFRSTSGIIHIYNKRGEELWTKYAEGFVDDSTIERHQSDVEGRLPIRICDIDGDESNEVLMTGFQSKTFSEETLYCFNKNGALRWTHGMGEGMRFGTIDFTKNPTWRIDRFFTIQRSSEEKIQLFVIAAISPSWPCKLAELDPATGRELHHYWHAGIFSTALSADIDGDGKRELVVGGINNAYNSACLVVFDPAHVSGLGPTTPEFSPVGFTHGSQEYYLLLPRTALGKTLSVTPYNGIHSIQSSDQGNLTIQTAEIYASQIPRGEAGIVYAFGKDMLLNYVIANDMFATAFDRAKKQGLAAGELDATYYERLKDSVLYWDGVKFVHEAVTNQPSVAQGNSQ